MGERGRQSLEGPRLATAAEGDDLADLSSLCFGGHVHPRSGRRRGGARELRGSWIMASGGKPVSHIKVVYNHLMIHGCRVRMASIGGVCTHPDFRGRGAATLLLDHCVNEATSGGATVLIISGGRGLYRRAQAVDAGPALRADIVPGLVRRTSGACSVRAATPEDWPVLARLYQQEPVRFVRSADFVAAALSSRHSMRAWVVESREGGEAYLLLAHDWDAPHGDPRRLVGEYAGSRAALVEALPAILEGSGLRSIGFDFPAHDGELRYLFERDGVALTRGTIRHHTVRLLNLPRLMQGLRPFVEARLMRGEARQLSFQQGKTCRFAFGDEEADFGLGRSTGLVFGGPKGPRVGGELGRALAALFPIPLPMPGMNYV